MKRTFWAKMSYWQKSFHPTILEFKWKTLNFMGNSTSFCRVAVKTINHLSGKTNSPQLLFVKFDFLTFSKNELKKLLMLSKCFSGSLFKSVHYVTRETFDKKQGLEEKNLKSFLEVELFAWRLSSKSFRPVVESALYVSGNFLRNSFYLKNVLPDQFRNIKWTFSALPRNFATWSSKLRSISPDDPFEDSL